MDPLRPAIFFIWCISVHLVASLSSSAPCGSGHRASLGGQCLGVAPAGALGLACRPRANGLDCAIVLAAFTGFDRMRILWCVLGAGGAQLHLGYQPPGATGLCERCCDKRRKPCRARQSERQSCQTLGMVLFSCIGCPGARRWVLLLLFGGLLGGTCAGWAQPAAPAGPASGEVKSPVERQPLPWTYAARVTRVFDGDTLWVKPLAGGRYRKLRLDGVDAPEICQSGGPAARAALTALVLDQVVTVRVRAFDDYGRALAQVSAGGDDMAAALVRSGHAWSARWRRSLGPYAAEELQARAERKGVFVVDSAETPREFRRRHGPCPMP